MTIFEYLQVHLNTTSGEITKGMNKRTPAAAGALSQLYIIGRVVKPGVCNGIPIYRINDMFSGYNNSLTMMFNQLLNRTRQGAA